ncbi:MAG: hypothetical protein B7Z75_10310 [Acidocella sp. 20-57-95]|nr:MAG: hypothetical protein B7Z75_10310 [Acidocella sp. 20-57-95]OYV59298.1 MAG: hypothetical protein B7Z71_08350 [Acidocella sp. 21-58-7]HQT63002.1 hypothetical protein [Acidocella sp.]HQU03168.1 hypothetical protein [Acidocella sp.]
MSETAPATQETPPEAAPAALPRTAPVAKTDPKPAKPRGNFWPLLGVAGFLVLAAGEGYLWTLHQTAAVSANAQISVLQAQLSATQQQLNHAQPAPDSVTVQADLGEKLTMLTAQVQAMQAQAATDHGALTTLAANNVDVTKLAAKITTLNRLESARIALDSGLPLGDIPNAPAALAKYATQPPPTEAALRLSFPPAAEAANNASVARVANGSAWTGALQRLESLVTISNGTHVIMGAPAAAITAQAQTLLDAGDLAGAVAALNGLSTQTQAAMGDWLTQAKGLLAARAAIISLADQP